MWVEADLNMVGTEALVRQFLYARRYVEDKFGVKPKTCWEPDTFGHIWTLPQIINKTGGHYYYFMRCGPEHPIFWWESPDGSRVLAFTSIYNNIVTSKNIVDSAIDLYKRYGVKTSMFVYGVGNHGGGATIEDIKAAHEIQKKPILPKVVFSSAQDFFEEVEKELDNKKVPVVNNELQFIFDGCYTTHSDIKRYNRLCEKLLLDAEKLSVLSGTCQTEVLQRAWLNMLFNQFHDILDGSGASEAYILARKLAQETLKTAKETIDHSLSSLAEKIKFSSSGVPIIVFNTLSWDRFDIVKVRIPSHMIPRSPIVVSMNGKERLLVQVCGEDIYFKAKVPSMGYKTYYLVEGEQRVERSNLLGGKNFIENEYFRIEIDKGTGTISLLYDKKADKSVFKMDKYPYTRPVLNNLLQVLYELPHPMSAWIIGEISRTENLIKDAEIELVETGPVKATIKVTHRYHKSVISQNITLYEGIPRVDFYTTIDWQEISDDKTEAPMLKVSFTPTLGESKASFEAPFGYIQRVADGTEVPALRWVDLSDEKYGLSILNDCKYGFDAKGNTLRMTLARTSYSPDPRPDQGVHEVFYSLYPHKGDWKEALTFRKGYEVNHSLEAYVVTNRSGSECRPEESSFMRIKPDNAVVSAIKLSEDSDDYIVRIYEAIGTGSDLEIVFDLEVQNVSETDLVEKEVKSIKVEGKKLHLSLEPFEIKTLRIRRKTS